MSWSRNAQMTARAIVLAAALLMLPAYAFAQELTLRVPALGVDAAVETIGIIDGSLGTPRGPDNVGVLQVPGNLLVVGHRDWAGQTRAFAHLETLQPGDVVGFSDGRMYSVQAIGVWDIDGEQDAWRTAVAPTDGDVLTLISCTGAFSVSRHEYLQRVIVRAERID